MCLTSVDLEGRATRHQLPRCWTIHDPPFFCIWKTVGSVRFSVLPTLGCARVVTTHIAVAVLPATFTVGHAIETVCERSARKSFATLALSMLGCRAATASTFSD